MIIPEKDTPLDVYVGAMIVDFPHDNVGMSISKDNWKIWANSLVQEISFSNNGAPNPNDYDNMNQWARDVFYSMASFS